MDRALLRLSHMHVSRDKNYIIVSKKLLFVVSFFVIIF
jgi:hypothetical protein